MRFLHILSALVVATVLYGVVFERARLTALLAGDPVPPAAEVPSPTATAAAQDTPEPVAPPQAFAVIAIQSEAQPVTTDVVVRGRTEADRQVEVRAQTSGLVISEPRSKGTLVRTGETICEIDPGTRFADLQEARAQLEEARVSETAAARLAQGGFASTTSAVGARAALEAAAAAVARAEKEIEYLTIAAPFDGLLETESAELGSLLQTGAACATLIRLDPIRLVGFLPEVAVDQVRVGARATARLATGREVEGTVTFVSRSADPATRTFRMDVEAPNPDGAIRDGQTASITIASEAVEAHLVPPAALTLDDGGVMGVRVVDADSRAAFVPVDILRDTQDGVWITGLDPTAQVIVVGQEYVTDGVRVAPQAPPAGPEGTL